MSVGNGIRVSDMRRAYRQSGLSESDLAETWWVQFGRWFADAVESGQLVEPNAMVLATVDPGGRPSARTVLLKQYDQHGFVFFTNYRSRKGRELTANPQAALVFSWVPLERQVVVRGSARRVSREETVAYFGTRPYRSRLATWASPQSDVVPSRSVLEDAVAELAARWPEGAGPERAGPEGAGPGPGAAGEVPAPEHWGGFRVAPETVEFWQGREDRLHDRLQYRQGSAGEWVVERLAP